MWCDRRSVFLFLVVSAVAGASASAGAQMRRQAGPGEGPTSLPPGIPRIPRLPYAGVWSGSFTLGTGPLSERAVPFIAVFDVADSASSRYTGYSVHPGGPGRAPHLETAVRDGVMTWKQSNSGGGFWVYTGRIVSPDSIAGTVALRDWPQLPAGEKPPAGTFALVRRPPRG